MICRFFFSFAFQAAGGEGCLSESLNLGSGESDARMRGERRRAGDVAGVGDWWGGIVGDERPVKSRASTSGEVDLFGTSSGDVRSRLSTARGPGLAGSGRGTWLFAFDSAAAVGSG